MPILNWLAQNYGTVIICAIIVGIFALLIVSLIRDKKAGKSSCCGGCAGCAMSGQCHAAKASSPTAPDAEGEDTSETQA